MTQLNDTGDIYRSTLGEDTLVRALVRSMEARDSAVVALDVRAKRASRVGEVKPGLLVGHGVRSLPIHCFDDPVRRGRSFGNLRGIGGGGAGQRCS